MVSFGVGSLHVFCRAFEVHFECKVSIIIYSIAIHAWEVCYTLHTRVLRSIFG